MIRLQPVPVTRRAVSLIAFFASFLGTLLCVQIGSVRAEDLTLPWVEGAELGKAYDHVNGRIVDRICVEFTKESKPEKRNVGRLNYTEVRSLDRLKQFLQISAEASYS